MVQPSCLIQPVQIAASDTSYFSCAFQRRAIIKKLTLTNTDNTAGRSVTIWITTNGAATTPANMLIDQLIVGPLQTVDVSQAVNHVMESLDNLHAICDQPAKVTMRMSGVIQP